MLLVVNGFLRPKLNLMELYMYKARLVAKCYNQEEGLEYFNSLSPIIKLTAVKLLLSTDVAKHWFIHQHDNDNAFLLHCDLDEEVYMSPSLGYPSTAKVYRLLKSLYVLKQASRQWFLKPH